MKTGAFKKGRTPWNKGMKGIHLSPATEFKKGEIIGKDHPSWKGGIQFIKNDCVHVNVGANQRVRRPKKVYEEAFGEIPKGWVLYHLDKVRTNDDLDNLIAIPRVILMMLNANRLNSNYHEIKSAVENYEKHTRITNK